MSEPYYADGSVELWLGDCLDVLRSLPECSVDSVCTDPPYGLEFMGKEWDSPWKHNGAVIHDPATERGGFQDGNGGNPYSRSRIEYGRGGDASVGFQAWCEEWAAECLRVLKPGGHMLAFGGCRTWHRLACAVEDAGFEVRDSIAWLYGSGFPKSLDVSKAIDKAAGADREVVGRADRKASLGSQGVLGASNFGEPPLVTAPATDDARTWQGWGTALKPAFEPIVVARKPLSSTVAATVLAHGTGALNIDACRVGTDEDTARKPAVVGDTSAPFGRGATMGGNGHTAGRWPANVVLDEHHEPVLRLRYNLSSDIERTIRESFGARTDHLPPVREEDASPAEPSEANGLLLADVLRAVDGGQHDGREGDPVRPDAHDRIETEDGRLTTGQGQNRAEVGDMERRPVSEQRLRDGQAEHVAAGRADVVPLDGEPQRPLVHTGAQAGHGSVAGPSAPADGDRSPSQRSEGRQPAGQLGVARVERGAPHEARGGRRGDVQAAAGERTSAPAPLDVLRRECPPGWVHYFDVIGHRRESQAAALDAQSGDQRDGTVTSERTFAGWEKSGVLEPSGQTYGSSGGASRFFYTAKAPGSERVKLDGTAHPTVKPLDLMRWLVRLVTPPRVPICAECGGSESSCASSRIKCCPDCTHGRPGVVLEPFAGSGTTVEACLLEGFRCIAIEREADYMPLIMQRINRRIDPVAAVRATGDDGGLFDLLEGAS